MASMDMNEERLNKPDQQKNDAEMNDVGEAATDSRIIYIGPWAHESIILFNNQLADPSTDAS